MGLIREALERHIDSLSPLADLEGSPDKRRKLVAARLTRAFARLKVGAVDADTARAELVALGWPAVDDLESLLRPSSSTETYEQARRAIAAKLACAEDAFVVSQLAKRRTRQALHELGDTPALGSAFRLAYRAMFEETLVPIPDSTVSGDYVVDAVAKCVPEGICASVMGVQNIKGTGLDFVYRWVSIDMTVRSLAKLDAESVADGETALRELLIHDDYGVVDARLAAECVAARRQQAPEDERPAFDACITKPLLVEQRCEARLSAKTTHSLSDLARKWFGETLDFFDAFRRRGMARRVIDDLVHGQISHATAASRRREITNRSKGAWAMRRS